tara:strand:- start:155 stop:646 length:492 start_codon:yes stop_codon:yes gene_type:complete
MAIIKPNNNTLSAITALPAAISTGKVLQIVSTSDDTNVTFTNATYGDVITLNITPTKTTSDILVQANMQLKANSTTGQDQGTGFKILRDSTEILTSGGYQQYIYSNGANIDTRMNFSVAYLDTAHSTTSQITYKIQGNNNTGGGSLTFNDAGKSTIWLMEIDQ